MHEGPYVAIVTSEPIIGIPSNRIYGPYDTSGEAWSALLGAGITTQRDGKTGLASGWSGAGVLPLRDVETIVKERP
jgi:hypothetical protein